jgi:hypothetical protein
MTEDDSRLSRLDEMIEQLGCGPDARTDIKLGIKRSLDWFESYDTEFARENRGALAASARAIAADVKTLLADLEAAPDLLRGFLYLPLEARRIVTRADVEAQPIAAQSYMDVLLSALRTLCSDCEGFLAEAQPEPPGPERKRAQRHCLRLAYILMRTFSDHPITGNRDGPLLILGSLLYEALTGHEEINLSRHYQDLQRNPPPVTAVSHEEQANRLQAQLDQAARDEEN